MNMHVHVCVCTRTRTCAHMWQGVQVFELQAWSQLECEVLKKEERPPKALRSEGNELAT